MLLILSFQTVWAAADSLQVQVGEKLIYCAVKLPVKKHAFQLPMQDGVIVATEWTITVGRVRKYWLDEKVAKIIVLRRVEPDLLTRSWLLIDVSSGISLRVHDVKLAVDFLTHLRRFPALDRSLLVAKTAYRVGVEVEVLTGDIKKKWWTELWPSSQTTTMHKGFKLP